jgi:DHA3 family macrolide efflux protein-like MFS transporter
MKISGPLEMAGCPVQEETSEKLWTSNFLLLWQGQFISMLGDVIYGIALGFWVLAVTGSTVLMGTLMAATTLPKVLVSPFAGVWADRTDRKRLLIVMDLIRGLLIVLMGVAAYSGFIRIWMVFLAGIILGVCGAFFTPTVHALIPDIVSHSKLMKANSFLGMIQTGSNIIGNSVGGFLFQIWGAPLMFLFNGFSYMVSGFLEIFLKIPGTEQLGEGTRPRARVRQHFFEDMKEGYLFVWRFGGLRYLLIMISVINFILCIAMVLLLPLYQKTKSLGPTKYGISMAFLAGGLLVGMVITSVLKIPSAKKMLFFVVCVIISSLCFILFAAIENFSLMVTLIFMGGIFIAMIIVLIHSTIQLTVPQEIRGKVFALINMCTQALMPLGMILGGTLAKFIPIRVIIVSCFSIELLLFVSFSFLHSVTMFFNSDPVVKNPGDSQ